MDISSIKSLYETALLEWQDAIGDPSKNADEAEVKAVEAKARLDKAVEAKARFEKHDNEHKAALNFRTERPNFSVQTDRKSDYKSLGTLVAESHKGGKKFNEVEFDGFNIKATLTSAGLTSVDLQAGIVLQGVQRPTVADLMPNGETGDQLVRLVIEQPFTNTADMVAEGGQKPEMAFTFAEADFPVRKVAGILPVTDEMLDDHPAMRSYVDQRGVYCVLDREDRQLISGAGTGQNLTGILNVTGIQTLAKVGGATPTSYGDTIHQAITKVQVGGFDNPSGMIVNPLDWEKMALEKDANGQYFGPGPFYGPYGNGITNGLSYWGLQVISTQNCPQGTAIVGAFRSQAQIFRRTGITVKVSDSHADYFQYNKQAFRFEERLSFAVLRPSAFVKITGL